MLGIFLDQETTGLDAFRHRLLEVACKVVNLSTGQLMAKYQAVVSQPQAVWQASDTTALSVNGFTWDEVQRGKPEEEVSKDIVELFQGLKITRGKAVFICQNPSFDRAFFSHLVNSYKQETLLWPYHWLDLASMYWALEVEKTKAQERPLPDEIWLSKDQIAQNVHLPKEQKPHRAMQGVDHLLLCYQNIVGFPEETVASTS